MGTFLNPGKNAFEEAVRSEIYVDKTDMILHLNAVVGTKQKYVSVSSAQVWEIHGSRYDLCLL